MAIWSFSEQGDENTSGCSDSNSPITPPSICPFEIEIPLSSRLEVGDIDAVPFSQNFADLFDGLGLHVAQPVELKRGVALTGYGSPDASYDIENYPNIRDIDPEWKHDDIEEIVVMSHKRSGVLPTIQEDVAESSVVITPTALLSDFEIEEVENPSCLPLPNCTKMCVRRDNGQKYLIKRRRARRNSQWSEQAILETLAGLSLPLTAYMRWTFHSGEHVYVVTDYHPGGSLMDLVNQHGSLGSHRAVFYASELAYAISSLHAAGIVHRDLQPQNILLDADGHIVVTNFEHAEFSSTIRSQGASNCSLLMYSTAFRMNEYRAPEVYMGWSHDEAVDCWSFGMVLYFMFFGTHPYGGREGGEDDRWFYDRVVGFGIPTESLRLVHPMARDLILKCLERNPSMRWTMDKIKTHGYFALVNWDQVSDKRLDVPSFRRSAMEVDRNNFRTEAQRRHASMNPTIFDNDRQLALNPVSSLRRSHSVKGATRSRPAQDAPVLPELFQSLSTVSIPPVIQEEDEPTSISASTGHPCTEQQQQQQQPEESNSEERISRFWADIDLEDKGSAVSVTSLEFGGSTGVPYSKAPKLRKHRSAIHCSQRLFNLSTSSFQNKLRKKHRSSDALQTRQGAQPIEGLPMGVHQIGSGIGFTYNVPSGAPSKVSVCSFVPPTCLFHGGFSGLNLNLGLGLRRVQSVRRVKAAKARAEKAKANPDKGDCGSESVAPGSPVTGDARVMQDVRTRYHSRSREEVGNGTFIREMYRTPSWILSPPESLPSPLALVNSIAPDCKPPSPILTPESGPGSGAVSAATTASDPELLTPATLVDSSKSSEDIDHEVKISIPKGLKLDLDFVELCEWAGSPDATLRLVPQTPKSCAIEEKLRTSSYVGMGDDSVIRGMHLECVVGGC